MLCAALPCLRVIYTNQTADLSHELVWAGVPVLKEECLHNVLSVVKQLQQRYEVEKAG